jgi:tight adherence protein C
VADIQLLLLSLFFALSLGITIWSIFDLNREARAGSFDAEEMYSQRALFRRLLPYIQTLGHRLESIRALDKTRAELRIKLNAAGKADSITPDEFLAAQLFAVLPGLAAGYFFMNNLDLGLETLLGCGLLGFGLPLLSLSEAVKQRKKRIRRVIPYTLDLLTLAVEAGLDFSAALMRIGEKLGGNPLQPEIKRLVRDMSMGKPRADALRELAARTQVEELQSVVSALIQADELGSSLAPTLRIQAAEMRRRRFELAEKLAMKAPVKMLAPLVLFIFPIVFLIVFSPIIIQFFYNDPLG